MIDPLNYPSAIAFVNACMTRFIDYLQRRGLSTEQATKLRKVYSNTIDSSLINAKKNGKRAM